MPPSPPGTDPPPPRSSGITMLGASESGKTSFLAALQIALLRQPGIGWSLSGDDDGSTEAMIRFMNAMSSRHEFPKPTLGRHENYHWSLIGSVRYREWHWWGFRRRTRPVEIKLDLMDGPGEAALDSNLFVRPESRQLIDSLARSSGIVLFFDPELEASEGEAFQHLYGVLTLLRSQVAPHGKLPHYVAFCINKFDAVPVFRSAQALRVLQYDEQDGMPSVPEEYAQEFFERLLTMSRSDDASMILPLLRQTFYEDRIRFFVTSAIGFYINPAVGEFDHSDYQNHIPAKEAGDQNYGRLEANGTSARIRGGVYPINVVEPILWLGRIVARAAGQ
jgi:hypothetical protein